MDPTVARRRFAAERVARLATVGPGGQPHLVPVTFAVLDAVGDGVIVFAVDHKPKRARQLRRLRNIAASPLVSFLVDHYTEEWSELWWVRADAIAEIVPADAGDSRFVAALEALAERYPQYRALSPDGPVVWSTVTAWSGWAAAGLLDCEPPA